LEENALEVAVTTAGAPERVRLPRLAQHGGEAGGCGECCGRAEAGDVTGSGGELGCLAQIATRFRCAVSHHGSCFCGAVELKAIGSPEAMGYCHCRSCRSWSGGPANAFSLWKPESVQVMSGAEHVATFQKTEMSQRQYCAKCGGHLMTNHPTLGGAYKIVGC